MRLSALQRHILRQCFQARKKLSRARLVDFYNNAKNKPKSEDQINIITKSIERLITKGLLVGYGVKTAEKWFIREISLTRAGQKAAREALGKQQKLKI
ncbi:MAG: hypothetical protein WCT37_01025 [Patescibacteria group bacterium]|jgi:hypothetical protein